MFGEESQTSEGGRLDRLFVSICANQIDQIDLLPLGFLQGATLVAHDRP